LKRNNKSYWPEPDDLPEGVNLFEFLKEHLSESELVEVLEAGFYNWSAKNPDYLRELRGF
jgi:hypothetical protein